jgi:hypothetical protein
MLLVKAGYTQWNYYSFKCQVVRWNDTFLVLKFPHKHDIPLNLYMNMPLYCNKGKLSL